MYSELTKQQPPGPLPWPIVGNTLGLPKEKPWYMVEQLSKDYKSPVITFWIGRSVLTANLRGSIVNQL